VRTLSAQADRRIVTGRRHALPGQRPEIELYSFQKNGRKKNGGEIKSAASARLEQVRLR
jgi:hypothetical protein